ncbi:MAG: N-acetylmuramoyl-L-alanine amidase, partial [Candidatus Omnitrophota bacterium]
MQIIDPGLEFKGELTKRERTDYIVLHHADASKCTIYDIHRWHLQRDFLGCGYHFFINKLGEIYAGRPHDTIGAHTQYYNYRSLGICCEGSYMEETQPLEQVNAVVDLLVYLKKNFYPDAKIVG